MEEKKKLEPNSKKKIDIKKNLRNLLALVLVAVISIAGTLAYLSTLSEEKKNSFVGSEGIKVQLTEDKFDNDGTDVAKNYTPGKTIPKDPTMENITGESSEVTEWVAIAVSYSTVDDDDNETFETYDNIKKIINPIAFNKLDTNGNLPVTITDSDAKTNGDYWTPILEEANGNKYAIYMYCRTLESSSTDNKNKTTYPLFDSVTINDESTLMTNGYNKTEDRIEKVNLPKFNINVIGAAIMNEYYTSGTKSSTSPVKATKLSDLDATDLANIKNDLKTVLEKHITKATNQGGWGLTVISGS